MFDSASTLRSIAIDQPATIRVFEHFKLDYCCGGTRTLADACASKGLNADEVLAALEQAFTRKEARPSTVDDIANASLTALIRHIVETHHVYVRAELSRLLPMAQRVVARHGAAHPEAIEVENILRELATEIILHLRKEELILFPYIESLERKGRFNADHDTRFGTVENPIETMLREHESAGQLLLEMRTLSADFTPPVGACPTFIGFYDGLAAFERDLHRHVHLENNLLFPRAIALEKKLFAANG